MSDQVNVSLTRRQKTFVLLLLLPGTLLAFGAVRFMSPRDTSRPALGRSSATTQTGQQSGRQ